MLKDLINSTPFDFIVEQKAKKPKPESEKTTETYLKDEVKARGGWAIKFLPSVIGLPDRICLKPKAGIFFVELKTQGRKPKKAQTNIHNKLKAFGFKVYVIDTKEKVNECLKIEFEC